MIITKLRLCLYATNWIALATLATCVQAETSPYYLGASLTRGHDSNVFRVPDFANPQSDSYTTTSLLAGFDQPISRQRVYTSLEARRQNFNRLDSLDNNGYKLDAGLDWETINNFSGSVKFDTKKALAAYGTLIQQDPLVQQQQNIKRERNFSATVQRGTARNDLQIFGAFNTRNTDYSAFPFSIRDNSRRAFRLGTRWHRNDLLTLGAALVEARGKYPNFPDEYTSHGIEFTGDWKASGASWIDGRIAYERRHYQAAGQRNFSGFTGLLSWKWQPTGKLTFTTSLVRDADDSERFVDDSAGSDLSLTGSRVTNSLLIDAQWQATAKIAVNANFRYSDRKLVSPLISQTLSGTDTTRRTSLGANYAATNNLSLGCSVGRETRSTDFSGSSSTRPLSFPFTANTASCYVQALLK